MYVMSKPQKRREDLCQWETHFHNKGINCWIQERADGTFQLEVDAPEVVRLGKDIGPIPGPCKFCGEWPDPSKYYKDFDPLFFCCPNHMKMHRNQMSVKYNNKTWDEMILEGSAPDDEV